MMCTACFRAHPHFYSASHRSCMCSVFFTGHSMGGGIAAMASMLLRDGAFQDNNGNQQQPWLPSPPPSPSKASTVAMMGSDSRTDKTTSGLSAEQQFSTPSIATSGECTPWDGGPAVISFATPCCVSLDLARGCQKWVQSIVYADDAVPRLSTVSLDLLKEDMTGK